MCGGGGGGDIIQQIENIGQDVVNTVVDIPQVIGGALADVDSAVHNAIPGGWATVGAAALMAYGIYDPELLASADSGTLTTTELSDAGYNAETVANGVSQAASDAGFTSTAEYNTALANGFTDAGEYNAATSAGFTNAGEYQAASSLGYTDASSYAAGQAGGFANAGEYQAASSLGYTDAGSYAAGQAGGFTNAAEYTTATSQGFSDAATYQTAASEGFSNASTYQAATNAGFTNAGEYGTAQTYGYSTANDFAQAAQQAGLNTQDFTTSLNTLTNSGYNPANLEALTQNGYNVQSLTSLANSGYTAGDVSTFAGQGFTPNDLSTLAGNGFNPAQVTQFTAQGFGPQDLSALSQSGFTPTDLTTFTQNGFTPQQLGAISNGGFNPAEITNLTTEGGFTPESLSQVAQGGYTNADIAQFSSQGMTPQQMVEYTQGINPATGLSYAETGSGLAGGGLALSPEQMAALELGDTAGFTGTQLAAAAAAGYLAPSILQALGLGPAQPDITIPHQQWFPIPTYTSSGLINPGENPGMIAPASFYGQQQPGTDQYYWGQHGYVQGPTGTAGLGNYNNNTVAPAQPYSNPNAVNLGQVITPEQLGYPSAQEMSSVYGPNAPYNPAPIMAQDQYTGLTHLGTAPPAMPGYAGAFTPGTQAQMAQGQSPTQQLGQSLNYVAAPAVPLAVTNNAGFTPAQQLTSVSPSELSAQLVADANAAGGH